jgi:ABC-type multidrug transport system fused ATPase/permease subunit
MLTLNWQVALACALTGPVTLAVSGAISRPINKRSAEFQKAIGQASSEALNTLEGVQAVKSFLAEDSAERRFLAKASAVRLAAVKMASVFAGNAAWMGTGSVLPFIVTFGYGGYMAVQGRLTIGGILALVNLCNHLGWPLAGMGRSLANVRRSLGAFDRVMEILDLPRDVDPVPGEGDVERHVIERRRDLSRDVDIAGDAGPSITVRDLAFEYVPGAPVLKDVSLEIPPGSLVVLAGKSGCGKSTLIKILAGLYRPSPGTVFIGGRDLHYEAGWARSVTAYLPQEPFLFSGSLRENLELAKPEAVEAELRQALSVADALEFVERDEDGLDRTVSERGTSFSGGERQRLSIARTLLKGGSVLLVDEPTASVDRESEERIWTSLLSAMKGKTCVVATHRLEIAERADLILVMDGGRIVERGTHADLYRPGSVYSGLVGETGGVVV